MHKLIISMIEKIKQYAIECHENVNHMYGDKPYSYHLSMVFSVAKDFSYLIPENDIDDVYGGCWTHDLIEDAMQTYNDVKKVCGERVADIAYALTNEKGKTREERANDKYYQDIKETKYATFVKLCDRIANIKNSVSTNSRMLGVYKKENNNFVSKLYDPKYDDMFKEIENLLDGVCVNCSKINPNCKSKKC